MSTSVKSLREKGFKVRVGHKRYYGDNLWFKSEVFYNYPFEAEPRGGVCCLSLTSPDGKTAYAEAKCSKKDNYSKKMGVRIALGRALNQIETIETENGVSN